MKNTFFIFFVFILLSCEKKVEPAYFPFVLSQPTVIWNLEQDNTMEGTYIYVQNLNGDTLYLDLPEDFYITNTNRSNWMLGFGDDKKYRDNGSENLYEIKEATVENGRLVLGKRLKGQRKLNEGETLCFWRKGPAEFPSKVNKPLLNLKEWPAFQGESVHMGFIEYDSISSQYIMYFNEVDHDSVNLFIAGSKNLFDWYPLNDGLPMYSSSDFAKSNWAGWNEKGTLRNSPFVSDAIYSKGSWYLFLYGYNEKKERSIGVIKTRSLLERGEILPDAVLKPQNDFDIAGVFYPKVTEDGNRFYMVYDGVNSDLEENVCLATSDDLIHWNKHNSNPVISNHTGWRSSTASSEPNFIEVKGDTIKIMVSGTKAFKDNVWHRRITGRSWMDIPGNVADAQLGVYRSVNGGASFYPHANNPVMINDYSNPMENEHMGGNIEFIQRSDTLFMIYQAKYSDPDLKYNLFLRYQ